MGISAHAGYRFDPWISSHGVPQPPEHAYTSKQHWVLRWGGWPSMKSAPLHRLQWQGSSKDISRRCVSRQKQSLKIFQHKVRLLSLPLFNSVCDMLWVFSFFFLSLLNGCQWGADTFFSSSQMKSSEFTKSKNTRLPLGSVVLQKDRAIDFPRSVK